MEDIPFGHEPSPSIVNSIPPSPRDEIESHLTLEEYESRLTLMREKLEERRKKIDDISQKYSQMKILAIVLAIIVVSANCIWFIVKISDENALSTANANYDRECEINSDLQTNYSLLNASYQQTHSSYENLQSSYSNLQDSYSEVSDRYELQQTLKLESLAADYYQTIREELGPQSVSWKIFGSTWQEQVDFCANLAKHDERKVYWPEYEDEYYDWYGTYSYDDALAKLDYVLEFAGVSDFDTAVIKIEKILEFVNQNIEWQPDVIEKFFAPVETLSYGSGDCDDFSMLAAALFEIAGIDSAIGFFTDITYTYGHAMVLVRLDNLGEYEDYWYYPDLTSDGLSSGEWIIIEPQWTIDYQESDSIGDWILWVVADT